MPSSGYVPGRTIWTYTCNKTPAQTWRFGTDGTIRPVANTTLCLAAASAAQNAAVQLATCTSGNALQKWTW